MNSVQLKLAIFSGVVAAQLSGIFKEWTKVDKTVEKLLNLSKSSGGYLA